MDQRTRDAEYTVRWGRDSRVLSSHKDIFDATQSAAERSAQFTREVRVYLETPGKRYSQRLWVGTVRP